MKQLEGKVALVTGASSGIGLATALELARSGAKVVALARSQQRLEKLVQEIKQAGGTGIYVVADVSKRDQVDRAVSEAIAQFGRIDIAVLNAGVEYLDPVAQIKEEELRHMIDVNLFGVLHPIQATLPYLTSSKGQIAVVSSPMMHLNFPHMGGYAASKAASTVLVDTLRREVAAQGVRLLTCFPGHTETQIAKHMSPDRFPAWYGRTSGHLKPEEVARPLVQAIIRNQPHLVVGGPVKFLLTLKKLVPALANRIIGKITAPA